MADLTTDLSSFLTNLTAFAPIKRVSVTLTNAQVLAIRATPISLVAAPGASKRIVFHNVYIKAVLTAGYTETADNLVVRYVGTTGVIVSEAIETTGFIDQTGTVHTNGRAKLDAIATAAQCVNVALVLHNSGDGEFGGGNAANAVTVTTEYFVLDV